MPHREVVSGDNKSVSQKMKRGKRNLLKKKTIYWIALCKPAQAQY